MQWCLRHQCSVKARHVEREMMEYEAWLYDYLLE